MTWNVKQTKDAIELRNLFSDHPFFANVLITVTDENNIVFSMNGKAKMTLEEIQQMNVAITQALGNISQ